jgi:hypothetical protein
MIPASNMNGASTSHPPERTFFEQQREQLVGEIAQERKQIMLQNDRPLTHTSLLVSWLGRSLHDLVEYLLT